MTKLYWRNEKNEIRSSWKHGSCYLAIASAVFFVALVLLEVDDYKEKRYQGQNYERDADLWAFLSQSKSECNEKTSAADRSNCHSWVNEVLEQIVPARDLLAQETMASSTQGLLWVSGLQFVTGFLTLIFLGWTILQTRMILRQAELATHAANATLREAENTTKLNQEALDTTNRANALQLRPYIGISVKSHGVFTNESGEYSFSCHLEVKNIGKTEALRITNVGISSFYFGSRGFIDSGNLPERSCLYHNYIAPTGFVDIGISVPLAPKKSQISIVEAIRVKEEPVKCTFVGNIQFSDRFVGGKGGSYVLRFSVGIKADGSAISLKGEHMIFDDREYLNYEDAGEIYQLGRP